MRPTAFFPDDRRFILLLLTSLLAIVLGFISFRGDRALQVVIYTGYWTMLVTFGGFLWTLYKALRDRSSKAWPELQWRTVPWWPGLLVLGAGLLLLVHERFGFKILMDEVMLLGTSMSMHFEKTALVPMRGHDLQGAFQVMAGQLDKRPLFFPFLTSVLHDLTGYRPENVFVLNTLLTFVLAGLVYRVAWRFAGTGAAILGLLLLIGLPLLAQNATGGGFELLNLVMILATLLFTARFLESRNAESLNVLCFSAALLAQTRYESVIFLLPVAVAILWVWWRERRILLSWGLIVLPLLLVPYALQNQVFSVRESSWELAGQPGYEKVFSLSYASENFAHWLMFFFNITGEQSNSFVLSALGFLAAPFVVLWTAKTLPRAAEQPASRVAFALFVPAFLLHSLLYLCYFWGRFDDPVIRRLSLPLNLFLLLCVVVAGAEFFKQARRWVVLCGLAVAGLFIYSLPAMARHDYTLDYYVGREMEWRRDFIAAHPEKDYLVIDANSIAWIAHEVSATPILQAKVNKGNIAFNFQNRTFSAFYVFQRFDVDPSTGAVKVQESDDIGPDYQLETYWERRFTPLTVTRISRVISIRDGEFTPPRPRAAGPSLSPAEREKIRQEYFNRFIQRLP